MDKREIRQMMELLQIEDVTTKRQLKNGTITWKLPIKKYGNFIEVASFKTGYVRNNNSCYTNYQLNKRCESEPQYYETAGFKPGEKLYRKYTTRTCKLIPNELDRLEYLIKYCVKNYYIKNANFVADGEYVHKSQHEWEIERAKKTVNDCGHYDRIQGLEENLEDAVSTIMDHEEKIEKLQNKLQSVIRTARH